MIKFNTPEITEVQYRGNHLFASQSFIDRHPEIVNHVFVTPDAQFKAPDFSQYCERRIDSYMSDFDASSDMVPDNKIGPSYGC